MQEKNIHMRVKEYGKSRRKECRHTNNAYNEARGDSTIKDFFHASNERNMYHMWKIEPKWATLPSLPYLQAQI